MRRGGRDAIDHKALFVSENIGDSISVSVYVPNEFIGVVMALTTSRYSKEHFERADYFVDGKECKCLNLDTDSDKFRTQNEVVRDFMKYDTVAKPTVCVLPAKRGKHVVTIKHSRDAADLKKNEKGRYVLDTIVGF